MIEDALGMAPPFSFRGQYRMNSTGHYFVAMSDGKNAAHEVP
jgi:hypothetical protein